MGDEFFVFGVGFVGALTDEHGQPIGIAGNGDGDAGAMTFTKGAKIVVGFRDRPLGGAMDVVFGFGLGGVEGLDGIDAIVAEDAGTIGGRIPVALGQGFDEVVIPALRLGGSAAPIIVARMQDVVLEILELVVGGF